MMPLPRSLSDWLASKGFALCRFVLFLFGRVFFVLCMHQLRLPMAFC